MPIDPEKKTNLIHSTLGITVFLVLLLVLISKTLYGGTQSSKEVYRLKPGADIPVVTATGLSLFAFPFINHEVNYGYCNDVCSTNNLNSLDRLTVGSALWEARSFSAVSIGTLFGGIVLYLISQIDKKRAKQVLKELFLVAEAVLVAGTISGIVKHSVRRPRPYMYDSSLSRNFSYKNASDYLSFFSMHTAIAFSAAASFSSVVFNTMTQTSEKRFLYWLAFGFAAATGFFRVLSGDHFISDVIAGACVGTTVGLLLPALHKKDTKKNQSAVSSNFVYMPGYIAFTGTF